MTVDKKSEKIIAAIFSNGKRDGFRLFKESKTKMHPEINLLADTGYQGLKKLHFKTQTPRKKSKKPPLTKEGRKRNRKISAERAMNENVIGRWKRFRSYRIVTETGEKIFPPLQFNFWNLQLRVE